MFYDLNVPWTDNARELQRTVAFLHELGYDVVALTHTLSGKLSADLTCPIPLPLPFPTPANIRILRRCNIFLTDAATNHRIPQLQAQYDIIAARPTDERTLQQACSSLDVDLISLDLTQRFEKHFKFPMLGSAVARGVKIELCYSQALLSSDPVAKRNLINNAVQLIRVTRGRGLLFSSEAKNVLGIRAPSDIMNLASVWGLGHERGKDGLTREPRSVVEFARLKRTSYRGVIDVVYGGEKPATEEKKDKQTQGQKTQGQKKQDNQQNQKTQKEQKGQKGQKEQNQTPKRKADSIEGTPAQSAEEKPMSKRALKRLKKEQAAQQT